MKLGIYGGSFNPIHYGHLNVARQAIADLRLDRLIVLPANVSPFKVKGADGTGGEPKGTGGEPKGTGYVSPLPPRLEIIRAVFAGMENVVVDDREIRRGGVSYTIDTVREIIAEASPLSDSTLQLYFIIGQDSVAGLPRWREIDELRKLVTFKVYPRTKESSTEIRGLFEKNGVAVNPDAKLAEAVRSGVLRKNGFCPCRLAKLPEFFCPCDEFKAQLRDPDFRGLCHCRLYLKP